MLLAVITLMNIVSVAGNIGRDAEMRTFPSGESFCTFSVADSQGKNEAPIWWRCLLIGKRAEGLSPFLKKGSRVSVTGYARERTYTDKKGMSQKSLELRLYDILLQDGGQRNPAPAQEFAASDFDDGQVGMMAPPEPPDDVDDDIPI